MNKLIHQCYQLDSEYMNYPWTEEQWLDLDLNSHILIADKNGFILGRQVDEVLLLYKIVVCRDQRGRGLAKSLLTQFCEKACKASIVYLEVEAHNEVAMNFYLKNGFVKQQLKRRFYSDGSDAYIMTRNLAKACHVK